MITKIPKVLCGSPDSPLKIGDIEIQCYVLEDETRVLTQGSFLEAIGRARRAKGGQGASVDKLPAFLAAQNLNPFIDKDLKESTRPIRFKTDTGQYGFGYRAQLLPNVCDVYLKARDADALLPSQKHIAIQADIIMRGLAHVGIIALVDEATGYQEVRARKSLEEILERFIAKELQKWTKTFPDEFYEHLFRLKGWQYMPFSVRRPSYVGTLTNDLVYSRIAPGVLEELKRLTPKDSKGRRKHRYFQRLTEDIGHPKLREHLASVIALMKATTTWNPFYRMLQRSLPQYAQTIEMLLETEKGEPV